MPTRSTARASVARSKASSPPKASRQSQSPVGRRTRSSRSRSVDPEAINGPRNKNRVGRRAGRETSVSSVGSGASASGAGSRARTRARKPAVQRDLSMVAEDVEGVREARGSATTDDGEDGAIEHIQIQNEDPSSPNTSQMSGTTVNTSYSAQEICKLDPMMAEILPELLESATKILDLLVPKRAIGTEDQIENIVTELKVPGSRRGKLLHLHEQRYLAVKAYYGSDLYIRSSFVLRRLLGTENPEEGNFRPDPVIHAANLATLVTEFLVLQRGEAKTKSTLQGVCNVFPQAFIGKLDEAAQAGHVDLVDEIFDLALDFYTQSAMVCLALMNEEEDQLTPDLVLASVFYDQYDESDPEASFAQLVDGGVLKNILRFGQPYSQDQVDMVHERLALISGTFRYSAEAREAGDVVDHDQLNVLFPWLDFITKIVHWSRSRVAKISKTISKQGGIHGITESLVELIKSHDSQVDIQYEPPPTAMRNREPLPAAEMAQSNQSFLSTGAIQTIMKLKKGNVAKYSPKQDPASFLASPSRPRAQSKQASCVTDDYSDDQPRPIAEYTTAWNENIKEKNKKNLRPTANPAAKPRLIDPQPNAQKIVWNESQDRIPRPSRKRASADEESGDESEDEGFQEDQRHTDPARRAVAPPGPRLSPVDESSPPHKRQRVGQRQVSPRTESSRDGAQRRPERAEPAIAGSDISDSLGADSGEESPPLTATEISAAARFATAIAKRPQGPRGRRPWSDHDSDLLTRRIEEYGCAWSLIFHLGGWDTERDQLALKDHARTMKLNMLKIGMRLPLNFAQVSLGRKEIAQVRKHIPDYED